MQVSSTLLLSGLLLLLLCPNHANSTSFARTVPIHQKITVPAEGVYIVSVVSDPSGDSEVDVHIQVNDRDTALAAIAHDNVITGLSVALPLRAGDTVGGRVTGPVSTHNAIGLAVAFASTSKQYFTTVRSRGDTALSYGHLYASFYQSLASDGRWVSLGGNGHYTFTPPVNGIYWVMARPDAPNTWCTFDIGGGLFRVFSGYGLPTSASGAFFLTTVNHKLDMKLSGTSSVETATVLSFVYLEGNTPAHLGRNPPRQAYTALVDTARPYGVDEKINFNRKVELDVGDMYVSDRRVFRIRVSGTYIVSLRGHPNNGATLRLVMYHNTSIVFSAYSERGVSSGQSTVLTVTQGDELYVLARDDRSVGSNTMLSIALLWKST